jgi:hypothetical protein
MQIRNRVLLLLAGVLGCAGPAHIPPGAAPRSDAPSHPSPATRPERLAQSVVIVALDGVRWQDVFYGVEASRAGLAPSQCDTGRELMPNLHRLATLEGAALGAPDIGHPMRASGPRFVSLPGYAEIFTGRPSPCVDNECTFRPQRTLADEVVTGPGDSFASFVLSSWPRIGQVASGHSDRVVISTGRTGGQNLEAFDDDPEGRRLLEEGASATPAPAYGDFRPDRHTAALAMHVLRTHRPRFLFVGLGEPDEYAHHNDYPAYLGSLRSADAFIGEVASSLSESAQWGETVLFVTTDHGRAESFHSHGDDRESARVWLVGAGAGISARGAVASPTPRRLADIAPTVRALLGLVPDAHSDAGSPLFELWPKPVARSPSASRSVIGGRSPLVR